MSKKTGMENIEQMLLGIIARSGGQYHKCVVIEEPPPNNTKALAEIGVCDSPALDEVRNLLGQNDTMSNAPRRLQFTMSLNATRKDMN